MGVTSRLQFSANLGFLWTELPIDQAIQRAAEAGFHGVEMHWPDPADISKIKSALTSDKSAIAFLKHRAWNETGWRFWPMRVARS